jgi:hypothetical protein
MSTIPLKTRLDSLVRKRGAPTLVELMRGKQTSAPAAKVSLPNATAASTPSLFSQPPVAGDVTDRSVDGAGVGARATAPGVALSAPSLAGATGASPRAASATQSSGGFVEAKPPAGGAAANPMAHPMANPMANPMGSFAAARGPRAGAGAIKQVIDLVGNPPRWALYAVTGVVVALVLVWLVAYQLGQRRGEDRYVGRMTGAGETRATDPTLSPPPDPLTNTSPNTNTNTKLGSPTGSNPGALPGGSLTMGGPAAAPVAGPTSPSWVPPSGASPSGASPSGVAPTLVSPSTSAQSSELVLGNNYLVVEVLFRAADAERVKAYLESKRFEVKLIPTKQFNAALRSDPGWTAVVLPDRGVARDQFSSRKSERDALVSRVQQLGREWKAEDKTAPSTFASPLWARYDPAKP